MLYTMISTAVAMLSGVAMLMGRVDIGIYLILLAMFGYQIGYSESGPNDGK